MIFLGEGGGLVVQLKRVGKKEKRLKARFKRRNFTCAESNANEKNLYIFQIFFFVSENILHSPPI